jgi:5'-3' exonuclease
MKIKGIGDGGALELLAAIGDALNGMEEHRDILKVRMNE